MKLKKCNKCGIEKELDAFSFRKDTNRYKNTCKECINKAHREYRKNNLKEMREKDKKYYYENIEKRREQTRLSNQKNNDRIKKYKEKYYKENREEILEKQKIYAKENKEKLKKYHSTYYKNNYDILSNKAKIYRQINKQKLSKKAKEYYQLHKDDISQKHKKYYLNNNNRLKQYQVNYRDNNPDKVKESQKKTYEKRKNNPIYLKRKKEYRLENIEKEKEYMKKYAMEHKEERKKYETQKIQSNPVYALKVRVRKAIYDSFKRKKYRKGIKSEKLLGCDIDFFIKHLLNTYYEMYGHQWNGTDSVQIDHIIPLSTAETEEDVIKLCHYSNLQLLEAKDNRDKSNKLNWTVKLNNKIIK